MRIRELRLTRYGKFTDQVLALPHSDRDIHFIVGPNEAGKSTVRSAIGDWLYGIPARTPLAFLHPMPDLRLGGVLQATGQGGAGPDELSFDRAKGNKNTLRAPDGVTLAEAVLQPWLAQVGEETFRRLYALDHDVLVEGGDAILSASDDVGRMLFESAGGLQHLGQLHKQLLNEADALWGPRKSGNRVYYQAQEAFDKANADLKANSLKTRDWKTQHEELQATADALAQAKQRHLRERQQLVRLERMRRVAPILTNRDAATSEFEALLANGPVASLPADARQVYHQAMQQHMLLKADVNRLSSELERLTAEKDAIAVDKGVLSLATDIQELNERRLQYRAHATDIIKRREEIRLEWIRLQALAKGLGWAIEAEETVKQRLPAASHRSRVQKLIKEQSALLQKQATAQSECKAKRQQLKQAEDELSSLNLVEVSPALTECLDAALALGNHDANLKSAAGTADRLQKRLDAALDALGIWRMEPQALQSQLAPDVAIVQALVDGQRADTKELASLSADLLNKQEELVKMEKALQLWVNRNQPVSREQVEQVRNLRDADWVLIRLAPQDIEQHAQRFEAHISAADQLSDTRLERVEQEAQRATQADQIEYLRLDIQRLQGRVEGVQARINARTANWTSLLTACGLPSSPSVLPLEMGLTWLNQRQKVLDGASELADAQRVQANLSTDGLRLAQALWAVLQPGQTESSSGDAPALAVCIQQAKALSSAAQQAQGKLAALNSQIHAGKASMDGLNEAEQVAHAALEAWRARWQAALSDMGSSVDGVPDQIESDLEVMGQMEQIFTRIDAIRTERIDTMQADLDGMKSTALVLAYRVAPELTTLSAEEICLSLSRRLDDVNSANQQKMALELRVKEITTQLDDVTRKYLAVEASLNHLQALAQVQDLAGLDTAINRSDHHREVCANIKELDAQLAAQGDGLPLASLRQELAATEPIQIAAEVVQLNGVMEELVNEIANLSQLHGTQKAAFDALTGSDQGAAAEGRRQQAIAAMSEAAGRYLSLQTAQMLLKWSIEKFRETRQGPMLAKASGMFQTLTQGSFTRLLVDSEGDKPSLLGIRADGQQVGVNGMSDGTRDQLYLALRLAALELQVDQGLRLPLIADDLFINFDDGRTTAGLTVLGELSRKMQIVFLTHHDHLVPLAKNVLGDELNVVTL